ncbi:glycosyltransferase [Flavobacterium columnare]|uniref:Glycosyltransferase n=1 Tax=Flavobacterium columnare TaxID=996 RepID=A0A437U9G5_9FLAO|nr:glycosyltransferase [Flavobacterium columnare]RVU90253.1 glycosyltransferase [Flavobacterium columnare]
MLSILVPTYNYNIFPLVQEIHKQCSKENIIFEILCQDDFSNSNLNIKNEAINKLTNASFTISSKRLGRGQNLNTLAFAARYKYLLILEADSFPFNNNYIKIFLENLDDSVDVLFGGVKYPLHPKTNDQILRWKYGNEREIKSISHRLKKPYDFTFSWNLIIKREIFKTISFHKQIKNYGYEDLIFIKNLEKQHIFIHHIDNPLTHLNEENSLLFLEKSKKASINAYYATQNSFVNKKDIHLTKVFYIIKKYKLNFFLALFFDFLEPTMKQNLVSKRPFLFLLDLYKLGYLCKKIN